MTGLLRNCMGLQETADLVTFIEEILNGKVAQC